MQREDLIGGIGAIGSALAAVLGYLWNIGFIQLMFSFLAGSFSTYLIQHRLQVESEKRRISREHGILMRDKVYGPLFQAMNQALERVEDIKSPDSGTYDKNPLMDIKKVMEHYLFGLSEEELRKKVPQIYDDLLEYREARSKAVTAVHDLAVSKLMQAYPEVKDVHPSNIIFRLYDHDEMVEVIFLIDAILKKMNPLEVFKEAKVDLENPRIEVKVSGHKVEDLKKVDEAFREVEKHAWKENRLVVHEKQRKKIIHDLKTIIPKLEKRIVV